MSGDDPVARYVSLKRNEKGYGFNLHGEKGQFGQYVRAVDPASPSEICGLKPGDRVIEVDGVNVERETHNQVVARIRGDGLKNVTTLLVVDEETDKHFQSLGVTITMENTKPLTNGDAVDTVTFNDPERALEEDGIPPPPPPEDPEPEPEPEDGPELDVVIVTTAAIAIEDEEPAEVPPPPAEEVHPPPEEVPPPPEETPPPPPPVVAPPAEPAPVSQNSTAPKDLDLTDFKAARERATRNKKGQGSKMDWKEKHKAFEKL